MRTGNRDSKPCDCAECAPRVPRREFDERDVIAAAQVNHTCDTEGPHGVCAKCWKRDCAALDARVAALVPDDELARWTGVSIEDRGPRLEIAIADAGAITAAQLHAALIVVRDLLACIDPKAHAWQPQQDAISRAKQLLEEHMR